MVNDPIGDMLARVKNAYMARKSVVELPYSKVIAAIAKILHDEGYVSSASSKGEQGKKTLVLGLRYVSSKPALTDVKRKSKPGLRLYIGASEIPTVIGGMGTAILSTPQGIMTGKEAKRRHIGGELLCEVW